MIRGGDGMRRYAGSESPIDESWRETMATTDTATFELPGFRGELFYPGDAGYDEARAVFNGMIDRRPLLIARCRRRRRRGGRGEPRTRPRGSRCRSTAVATA